MKYARRCDATGKGINEGFCFGDGEMYFANKSDAEAHAIAIGYESLKKAYEADAYYWTQWTQSDIDEQGFYYKKSGKLLVEHEIYVVSFTYETMQDNEIFIRKKLKKAQKIFKDQIDCFKNNFKIKEVYNDEPCEFYCNYEYGTFRAYLETKTIYLPNKSEE